MCTSSNRSASERGQATIALVGVIIIMCVAAVALSFLAQAMVHRAHARNAADAVALATAVDVTAGQELRGWYQQHNVTIEQNESQTIARSGPSQAAAWAATTASPTQPAPALIAIMARAEQLLGQTLSPVQWQALSVAVTPIDAASLRLVAADLALCEVAPVPVSSENVVFELC